MTDAKSALQIRIYDGSRRFLADGVDILYTIIDGNQDQQFRGYKNRSIVIFDELPFFDNFGDRYTALAAADGYQQAGFTPIALSPTRPFTLDLMLIPTHASFNFIEATWDHIKGTLPFLASDVDDAAGRARYDGLKNTRPRSLAALLNITTAAGQIFLPKGTPLDYLKELKWDDTLAQDRFFAYCDRELIDQVRLAADHGLFAPEIGPGFFHPGATASWKQIQFGEANVQLTFHEDDQKSIDGSDCILVEPDIDYYKDLTSHALLEVLPNGLSGGLTNPEVVYVLRWIAGRHAGVPEFAPPYTIDKA